MHQNLAQRSTENISAAGPPAIEVQGGGDRLAHQALEAIYRRELDGLLRFLKRRVGEDLASDLAHEVFLRATTSREITHLVNPGGFLFRIAHNIIIDRARRRHSRIVTLPLIEAIDAPCAAQQEYALEAKDLLISFEQAMAGLPERTRRVFTMHRFEGKAYREIHRELAISLATVEYHMMKALAHLRAWLEQIDQPCPPDARGKAGSAPQAGRSSRTRPPQKNNFICN